FVPPPSLLDVRPEGDAKKIREIEEQMKLVAVVAIGVWPNGPWRLVVTDNPASPLKHARQWMPRPMTAIAGALLWTEAKEWGDRVKAQATTALTEAADSPWIVAAAAKVQEALASAAAA